MSPKAKRPVGESCWGHFGNSCTPQELKECPLTEFDDKRAFKVIAGKLACKECNDGILRTTAGHDMHYRTVHEGLQVYSSFASGVDHEESSMGGRANLTVPKGRDPHRASLLKELRALGVTAKELTSEGYAIGELKDAHYTFKEIYASGAYSLEDMCKAGVTRQIKTAGIKLKDLVDAGYSLGDLRKNGYDCKTLKNAPGLSPTVADLRAANFLLHDLREAGCSLSDLKDLRRPNSQHDPAFTLQDLKKEGYTCKDMRKAGFTLAELRSGYTAADMKVTHYTTKAELARDGFTLAELKLANFTPFELKAVGVSQKELLAIGFSRADIKTQ